MKNKFKYFLDGLLLPFECLIELFDFSDKETYNSPKTDEEGFQKDVENLRRDWEIIGRDFETVIRKVGKDHE